MKSMLIIALVAAAAFCTVMSAPAKDKPLKAKIIKHQPCTSKSTQYERIRFPSKDQASIKEDPERGEGCYIIQGTVQVKKPISGTVQIYADVRLGAKSEPEKCQKADSNQCGGVGSCIYCDTCASAESIAKKSNGLVLVETTDGKALDCKSGLSAGNYSNIVIKTCMPTRKDIMKMGDIDEDTMDKATEGGDKMFFVTLYFFDIAVNTKSYTQVQKMANTDNEHVIGCHKIAGAIYM